MKSASQKLFKLLISLMAGSFVLACSPVTPSVSKVSSTASDRSTPTSAGAGSEFTSNSLASNNIQTEYFGEQQTKIVTISNYKSKITESTKKNFIELNYDKFSELLVNLKTKDFSSDFELDDKYIQGKEVSFASKKTRIYLIVNSSEEKSKRLSREGIEFKLVWKPASIVTEKAHWSLTLSNPNMFGEHLDSNADAERVLNNLSSKLVGVVFEFNSNF